MLRIIVAMKHPEPEVLAAEIVEDLEAAMEEFAGVKWRLAAGEEEK